MFINTPFIDFNDAEISVATTLSGVYGLHDGSEVIYFGKGEGAEGIRGRLKRHKAGDEGYCTQGATYFNVEVCPNPSRREVELLTEYKNLWGKLPRCNDFIPSYSSWLN